jgi:hypothetical protein
MKFLNWQMDVERRKLVYSLAVNFATRIPGAVGVLFFLPLLRFGLGTEDYAGLLGGSALGMATIFLSGGFSNVGRRIVGEAYSTSDHELEATGFVSLSVANAVGLAIALLAIAAYCRAVGASTAFLITATLPPITSFFNTFDNVRAAYNEHYVTATLLIVWQVTSYTIGFLVPYTREHMVVSAILLASPYLLASLSALALLLRRRPYLVTGSARLAGRVMREGTVYAIADGLLTATLSLAVTRVDSSGPAEMAAWFGTLVRLFQIFLVPIILLLLPLSSYMRIIWNARGAAEQRSLARTTLLLGLAYGALVAVALLFASRLYIGGILKLQASASLTELLPCFLLFGAIVAFRSYSSIAYQVLDNPMHLSWWTTIAVVVAVVLSGVSSLVVNQFQAIAVYAFVAGSLMIVVLCWNAMRFTKSSQTSL